MTWASAVLRNLAVLGRTDTVRAWTAVADGPPTVTRNGWQIDVLASSPHASAHAAAALIESQDAGLDVANALMRTATRARLPRCSIVVADGQQAAALAWGLSLGLVNLGGGEYVVTSRPIGSTDDAWRRLADGMLLALDPCGPTYFQIPFTPTPERP